MRTESNATKVDLNDPSPARRASLSSTDERGAPLKRAATSRLNHHRETLTSPSVLRSLTGRRRRCGHRPDGVPRVRRHHQARRRQRRARFLRKCPSRRSPSRRARVRPRTVDPASASNLDANSNSWGLSAVTRQLPDGARHLARVGFGQMFFARRCFSPRAENPKTMTHRSRLLFSNDSPTRSPSPRVRPSSS